MCRAWAACAHTNTRCEQCSVNTWKISEQAEQKITNAIISRVGWAHATQNSKKQTY